MKQEIRLWSIALAGAVIWFFGLLANFALAPWSCIWGWRPALFGVTLICLAISAWAGVLSWTEWHRSGAELPGETGGALAHRRLLALAGVGLNAMFFIVIVAQAVPNVMLGGCE